jgi:hypothetical protein
LERPTRTGWDDLACPSPPSRYELASLLIGASSVESEAAVEPWTGRRTGEMQKDYAGIGIGRGPADSNERTCNVPWSASIRALTRSIRQATGHVRPRPRLDAQVYTFPESLSSTVSHHLARTRWRRADRSRPPRTGLGLDSRWRRAAIPVAGERPAFLRFRFTNPSAGPGIRGVRDDVRGWSYAGSGGRDVVGQVPLTRPSWRVCPWRVLPFPMRKSACAGQKSEVF